MRIRTTSESIRSHIQEYVAAKTGLLLTNDQMFSCLERAPEIEPFIDILREDGRAIVRPDFLEASVLILRAQVGDIPDSMPDAHYANQLLLSLCPHATTDQQVAFMRYVRQFPATADAQPTPRDLITRTGFTESLTEALLESWETIRDRSYDLFEQMNEKQWDSQESLSALFEAEHIPSNPDRYLDQRFIDYLAAQNQDLSRIHWRNFERLCSEFFSRHGRVVLSKQGGDGGIDIRVYPQSDDAPEGPPLIVIQCKRLSENQYVQIADVKALYEDARFEEANGSLFVTTGVVGSTNLEVIRARKYKVARTDHVAAWVNSIWRHHQTFTPASPSPYPVNVPILRRFVSEADAMRTMCEDLGRLEEMYNASPVEQRVSDMFVGQNVQVPSRKRWGKVGRNAVCPCGSGRKYKKCCLVQ